jgi:plastocyanin
MKTYLLLLILVSLGNAGFCVTHTITNSGFTFAPASITINLGDSVNFSLTNAHNAVEVSQSTWEANGNTPLPGFSTPFTGGLVLPAKLTVGTHYYVCTPHAYMQMKGVIIVQNQAGIKENSLKANISIYPNPSKGEFQLDISGLSNTQNYDLSVYDLKGEKVYTKYGLKTQDSYPIDLSDLAKNIYIVKINNGDQVIYTKVVVE